MGDLQTEQEIQELMKNRKLWPKVRPSALGVIDKEELQHNLDMMWATAYMDAVHFFKVKLAEFGLESGKNDKVEREDVDFVNNLNLSTRPAALYKQLDVCPERSILARQRLLLAERDVNKHIIIANAFNAACNAFVDNNVAIPDANDHRRLMEAFADPASVKHVAEDVTNAYDKLAKFGVSAYTPPTYPPETDPVHARAAVDAHKIVMHTVVLMLAKHAPAAAAQRSEADIGRDFAQILKSIDAAHREMGKELDKLEKEFNQKQSRLDSEISDPRLKQASSAAHQNRSSLFSSKTPLNMTPELMQSLLKPELQLNKKVLVNEPSLTGNESENKRRTPSLTLRPDMTGKK